VWGVLVYKKKSGWVSLEKGRLRKNMVTVSEHVKRAE
jgi:hypothetical protein